MYINQIIFEDLINSDGIGLTLVMQGCSRDPKCKGCHSPHTWIMGEGISKHPLSLADSIAMHMGNGWYDNLIIMGGEPLDQAYSLLVLLTRFKLRMPSVKVWLYTSHDLYDVPCEMLDYLDVIKTGRYDENLKTFGLLASSNQKFYKKSNGVWEGYLMSEKQLADEKEKEKEKEKGAFLGHIGIDIGTCNLGFAISTTNRGFKSIGETTIAAWNEKKPSFIFSKEDIVEPERHSIGSAGYDFASPVSVLITPGQVVMIPTGIKSYMNRNELLIINIRSSMGVKNHLRITNTQGWIDSDYYDNPDNEGHILIVLENTGKESFQINKGDRIAQGAFINYLVKDNDDAKDLRVGGLGSTN
jgi:dUTP pyrophosphatase